MSMDSLGSLISISARGEWKKELLKGKRREKEGEMENEEEEGQR